MVRAPFCVSAAFNRWAGSLLLILPLKSPQQLLINSQLLFGAHLRHLLAEIKSVLLTLTLTQITRRNLAHLQTVLSQFVSL